LIVGAVILCGGESRRMGQPKAWLPFGPERMLQRVVRLVSTVTGPIVVVAAPGQELPALPAAVLVARDPLRGRGPLQGLAAGLAALPDEVELAYATATDVPFLQPAWIDRLVALIGDHDLAIPRCDGFLHPLAALYRRVSVLPACDSLLRSGRLRPAFLIDVLRARIVAADELRCEDPELLTLRNLNTPEDYQSALTMAGHEVPDPATAGNEPRPPRVHVELFGVPRLRAGALRLAVEAADIGEALRALSRACPALLGSVLSSEGSLRPAYTLNINGQRFTTDPSTPLRDGDSLIVLAVDVGD
jgi:molybdenum cofactor guanylyltransferase